MTDRPTMRAGSVLSEAWRNLLTGTSRAALLAGAFALLVGTLAVADARAVVDVLAGAADYRAAGAAVTTVEAVGGIDGARCDALTRTAGFVGAGALRPSSVVLRALSMPSSQLTVWEVTPGLLEVIAGAAPARSVPGEGIWASADLAETLGVEPGSTLMTSDGPVAVAGVFTWPDDGRDRDLGYSVLVPVAAAGTFDRCWGGVWPQDDATANLLLTSVGADGADPAVGTLNMTLGAGYDVEGRLADRPTRWAASAALAVGVALGFGAVRLRRLEVASALHARVRKPHLAWQHLLEALAWLVAGTCVVLAALAWAAVVGNPEPPAEPLLTGARTVAAGAAAGLLGTLLGVLVTRERHLFRYFANR